MTAVQPAAANAVAGTTCVVSLPLRVFPQWHVAAGAFGSEPVAPRRIEASKNSLSESGTRLHGRNGVKGPEGKLRFITWTRFHRESTGELKKSWWHCIRKEGVHE
jgi:hypothetical protein